MASKTLSDVERNYMMQRLHDIDEEVKQSADLSASHDLTPAGRELIARLQVGNRSQNMICFCWELAHLR
jgi:hypothetical protein